MKRLTTIILPLVSAIALTSLSASELTVRQRQRVSVPEAHQAVAVGATSFYAIANRTIARYEKGTNNPLARWTAPAESAILHLNSGVVDDGKLYCANSNWPQTPLKNSMEVFEAETLQHLESRSFSETAGAINWVERHRGSWWIVFAFYGDADVRHTKLLRYDDQWNPTGEWTFPESVIQRFLPNSNSGGAFGPNGRLFVTGHDHAELYVLDVPVESGELNHIGTVAAPIAGQGIAWDRSDIGTLFGIVRRSHEVVSMRLSHADEYTKLQRPVEWIRHEGNPVLPPREGEFDATRCMNPWIVRDQDRYRLFYSDGGKTWGSDDVQVMARKPGEANLMSVSLLRLQNDRIALFYVQKYKSPSEAKYSHLDYILMRTSSDEGATWSEPTYVVPKEEPGYRVLNNDRVIQLKSGRLVVPVAVHYLPGWPKWQNSAQILCYLSDDQGETWRSAKSTLETGQLAQEPGVVELSDAGLMMFCRSQDCQLVSRSDDGGDTWSALERSKISQPTASPASIERIPSTGDLLMVWNNGDDPLAAVKPVGRRPFTAAISKDEGATWEHIRNIGTDPKGWYCYTAIEFVGDHVLLAHCEYPGLNSLQITRLPVKWLYQASEAADGE